ncbi:PREDICTED: 30S ribosomal protein S31, chloroplastic-like [Camelina sativa]|uniref:30S ribosomal protein S31, chloroplastic-like n=1 Tax=Camelina sativa TaxID=90675 RepID=A0ABM0YT01_CAMSA|nr:PREDICTED: 30S ribosomal protein S31, chloroplastic-like [Camelina sativa]
MASLILGAPPRVTVALTSSRLSSSHSETAGVSLSCFTQQFSLSASSPSSIPLVYCGRGDRKTAKGKRFNHSFGNARPRNKNKGRGPERVPVPPAPPRKDKFENDEKIKIDIDESLFSN